MTFIATLALMMLLSLFRVKSQSAFSRALVRVSQQRYFHVVKY